MNPKRTDPHAGSRLHQELSRLRVECALGKGALESLDIGAFAVKARGRVAHCSCDTSELGRWGLGLGASRRLQIPGNPADTARLRRLIDDAIERSKKSALLIRSSANGGAAIHAIVAPLTNFYLQPEEPAEPMASVIASNLEIRSGALANQIAALFGLSPAESRLARAMMNGRTPGQFAHDSSLSISTVRSQLRAVFVKTGVRRQVDLVRLLTSIPPLR